MEAAAAGAAAVFLVAGLDVAAAALRAVLFTLKPRLPLRIPLLRGLEAMMSTWWLDLEPSEGGWNTIKRLVEV